MNIKEVCKTKDGKPFVIRTVNDYDDLEIRMQWDGCIDIVKRDLIDNTSSYMHVCEVKEFIRELRDIVRIAEENFGDGFKEYWD